MGRLGRLKYTATVQCQVTVRVQGYATGEEATLGTSEGLDSDLTRGCVRINRNTVWRRLVWGGEHTPQHTDDEL